MRFLIACLFLLTTSISYSQPKAVFEYHQFNTGEKPYVETYFNFSSSSLNYMELPNGNWQAQLELTLIITKNGNTVTFSKTNVLSPETNDTIFPDFIDLQRFSLDPGDYKLEIQFRDIVLHDTTTFNYFQDLVVETPPLTAYVSDLVFIGQLKPTTSANAFTKGNQDVVPLVTDFFPEEIKQMMFYAEIYNSKQSFSDSTGGFIFLYKIVNHKTKNTVRSLQRITRQKADNIIPVIGTLDITSLPSGEYDLEVEIRNTKNVAIYTGSRNFKRANAEAQLSDAEIEQLMLSSSFISMVSNMDTLTEYIDCLRPIATAREKGTIDAQKEVLNSLELKKTFFYTFWATHAPNDPSIGWSDYKSQVNLVNKIFSTRIKKGYSTDRGRVWLQYGPPNVRNEVPTEPTAYPYEIWQYYKINQFSNKRFVFYNRDLVSNDYQLLHSDMFGEVRNQNWQAWLYKTSISNPDPKAPQNEYGGRANDYYKNPR